MPTDPMFMEAAVVAARQARTPFGCVLVRDGEVVLTAANAVAATHDPTAHAELRAIRLLAERRQRADLSDCVLYTTGEPCPMCAGAIVFAKIGRVVYGAPIATIARYLPQVHLGAATVFAAAPRPVTLEGPVAAEACEALLREFS